MTKNHLKLLKAAEVLIWCARIQAYRRGTDKEKLDILTSDEPNTHQGNRLSASGGSRGGIGGPLNPPPPPVF